MNKEEAFDKINRIVMSTGNIELGAILDKYTEVQEVIINYLHSSAVQSKNIKTTSKTEGKDDL